MVCVTDLHVVVKQILHADVKNPGELNIVRCWHGGVHWDATMVRTV